MKTNRIVITLLIVLLCSLSFASPSHAARIYNDMSYQVQVQSYAVQPISVIVPDNAVKTIRINPGERSDSLEWKRITFVAAFKVDNREQLCGIGFGAANQIVGGNYMMIQPAPSNLNNGVNCYVCDSNHRPIVGNGQC